MGPHVQGAAGSPGVRHAHQASAPIEPNAAAQELEMARRQITCSPSLPTTIKRTKLLLPRSSKAWSAFSVRPRANGTDPYCAPFGLRWRSDWTTDDFRWTMKKLGSSWPGSCYGRDSALSGMAFVWTARPRPVFSRSAHQEPGIYPVAPGGGRAHTRTSEQAPCRRTR